MTSTNELGERWLRDVAIELAAELNPHYRTLADAKAAIDERIDR